MQTIKEALSKLARSKFRSSFKLTNKDIEYINKKGLEIIESHARDFIKERLSRCLENDGSQTPTRGHPVFKAQHACACCCRSCLNKWYKVSKEKELTQAQQEKIVRLIMAWIKKELNNTNV